MSVTIYQHANCDKCDSGFCEHVERVMSRRKREEIIADEFEGVAAPLEPSPTNMGKMGNSDHLRDVTNMIPVEEWREKYYLTHRMHNAVIDDELFECQMLEAYAAAVSKNLQVDGRWNAALDKAAEMLSRMQVIAGQPRATVEKAVVEIRKLKEIAALRRAK